MDAFSLILRAVRESAERCRIRGNILAGLSGGADSVALLLSLNALKEEYSFGLSAVYVNHGLREAAAEEEAFCQALCGRLGVPCYVERVRVPDIGSPEAAAREARYEAFSRIMMASRSDFLALAHHANDQAETVLLHLMYGAGMDGLGGMRELRPPVWRPLLNVERGAIRDALRELGQPWREDESNRDTSLTRNAIRASVLPPMEAVFPRAVQSIGRTAEILREENDCLSGLSKDWLAARAATGEWPFLPTEALTSLHPALRRRVLRDYAATLGLSLEFQHVQALQTLLDGQPGGIDNLPEGWRALRTKTRLHFLSPTPAKHDLQPDALRVLPYAGDPGDGRRRQAVPERLLRTAILRTRRSGDRISPFGMNGSMKLKDYFIARGVDQPFRDGWPLLCAGGEVLWVIGVGASERLRAEGGEPCRTLEYIGRLPDE